jgi:hypothetical protein
MLVLGSASYFYYLWYGVARTPLSLYPVRDKSCTEDGDETEDGDGDRSTTPTGSTSLFYEAATTTCS